MISLKHNLYTANKMKEKGGNKILITSVNDVNYFKSFATLLTFCQRSYAFINFYKPKY